MIAAQSAPLANAPERCVGAARDARANGPPRDAGRAGAREPGKAVPARPTRKAAGAPLAPPTPPRPAPSVRKGGPGGVPRKGPTAPTACITAARRARVAARPRAPRPGGVGARPGLDGAPAALGPVLGPRPCAYGRASVAKRRAQDVVDLREAYAADPCPVLAPPGAKITMAAPPGGTRAPRAGQRVRVGGALAATATAREAAVAVAS